MDRSDHKIWKVVLRKLIPLPQRVILAIMCFLGLMNGITMRNCLSIAIVNIVKKKYQNESDSLNYNNYCPIPVKQNSSIIYDVGEYEWSEELQGVILSSFFFGYIITHIPGGILAEKFGGKYILGFTILSTTIFTLLTPLAIDMGGAYALITLRIMEGIGQGTLFPAVTAILAMWIPLCERSKVGVFVLGAGQLGRIIGTSISGIIMDHFNDWRPVFYFFGILGALWVFFFLILCSSDPDSHTYISDEEKHFLQKEMGQLKRDATIKKTPWKLIFTNMPMIALSIAQLSDFALYIMVADLPKYMSDVLHFDIKENGLYSSLPSALMWIVSIGTGFLSDWIIKKKYIGITNSRKLFNTIASTVPAIFIVAASYAGCDRTAVVVLFTVAMGIMGTFYAGMRLNTLDLSRNYAGTIMAISNGIGAMTGIIGPYIVGVLTPNSSLTEWRLVFFIAFVVSILTNIFYLIWGSSDIQEFDTYYINTTTIVDEKILNKENNENNSIDQNDKSMSENIILLKK